MSFTNHKQPMNAAALVAALMAGSTAVAQSLPPGDIPFGVFDPGGDYSDVQGVAIEHLFLPWEDVFLPSLAEAETYTSARDRALLVTIEPWTWTRDERNSPSVLQNGIASGAYDETMDTVCSALSALDRPLTIRWAQEMDDESGQFIWAGWEPQDYVYAYKRMIDVCRNAAPDAAFMWSPLGFENMADFYPGDDYVDVVGLSVFSLGPWEEQVLGEKQSFDDIFAPRYERALAFEKPIMVAELGFVGDAEHMAMWEADVRSKAALYPELDAVVYFNQQEVYPWPNDFGLPDWRRTQQGLN
ncbi:endoglucanase [Octadecabacter temperatus]|uniref:Beta-1,3-xylanase n=1 Tax=Octadecabacter temperatus TaxID=1458307 RepID=A0A0K0Y7U8_9RHOB|nr:glycosyl hydrolase [Octadecabacter temperatus]AKS46937.1 Beta-1,3-xylanase precursor [Octadecabacter temperatus]SIO23945.1 endoglucanase [Octadecabacter temperatus]